jgi:hypothetical protein
MRSRNHRISSWWTWPEIEPKKITDRVKSSSASGKTGPSRPFPYFAFATWKLRLTGGAAA